MHIQNLEVGLRRAMVGVFRTQGLSAQAANTKATQNMAAAEALFHEKHRARTRDKDAIGGAEEDVMAAMRAVAAWAHSL